MAVIRDPDERRLRALMMLEFRVKNGASIPQVAKEFGVSDRTVERTLTWMRKAGLVADAEDKILTDLVPLAHQAIRTALLNNDAEIALEIFKGILPTFSKSKQSTGTSVSSADELGRYLDQLRSGEGLLDGETVDDPAIGALPAAAASIASQGNPLPAVLDPSRPRLLPEGTPPVGIGISEGASASSEGDA